MEVKASSFMAFTPIFSAVQICKYARKLLTHIAISNASMCFLVAEKGK